MNITPRDRALLAVIPVLALCAAFYFLLLTPQRHTAAKLQTKIGAAQSALASAQATWQTGHAAAVELKRDGGLYSASRIAVPQVSNIPAMLRLLQKSADQADVSLQSISLSGSGSGGSGASPGTQDGATTVPVALTFGGGYQALNRLLTRMDRYVVMSRQAFIADGPLFGISNISVTPGGGGNGLTIQLTANIYQYSSAATVEGVSSGGTS